MRNNWLKVILAALVLATVSLWSVMFGTLSVAVIPSPTLQDVHRDYNHITIHEDGSYEGENRQGVAVTGCVRGALCDGGQR